MANDRKKKKTFHDCLSLSFSYPHLERHKHQHTHTHTHHQKNPDLYRQHNRFLHKFTISV